MVFRVPVDQKTRHLRLCRAVVEPEVAGSSSTASPLNRPHRRRPLIPSRRLQPLKAAPAALSVDLQVRFFSFTFTFEKGFILALY
jgi:hypothetical protein